MTRNSKHGGGLFRTGCLLLAVCLAGRASGAVVSGAATVIVNPFSSGQATLTAGDTNYFDGQGPGSVISKANLFDGDSTSNIRWTNYRGDTNSVAFDESVRAAATNVSAILTRPSYEDAASVVPWVVKLGGVVRQSGSIDPPTLCALTVFTNEPMSGSSLRFEATEIDNGKIAQMGEVFVYPTPDTRSLSGSLVSFARIEPTNAVSSSTNTTYVPANALDIDANTVWISGTEQADRWIEFFFPKSVRLSNLYFDNQRGQITDIQIPNGGGWTNIARVNGYDQYLSLNDFPQASRLRLFWDLAANGGSFGADTRVSVTAFFAVDVRPRGTVVLLK